MIELTLDEFASKSWGFYDRGEGDVLWTGPMRYFGFQIEAPWHKFEFISLVVTRTMSLDNLLLARAHTKGHLLPVQVTEIGHLQSDSLAITCPLRLGNLPVWNIEVSVACSAHHPEHPDSRQQGLAVSGVLVW